MASLFTRGLLALALVVLVIPPAEAKARARPVQEFSINVTETEHELYPGGPKIQAWAFNEARETRATLGRLVEFPLDDRVPVALCVEEGAAASWILEVAEREAVDLVVVGTHGRTGLDRLVLGSVAEDVVQQASTPVVTVRPLPALREAAGRPVRRLLYATDGLSGAGRVRAWATALGEATGADLDVVELGSVDAVVRHAVAREADLLVLDTNGDIPLPGVAVPGVALGGVTRRLLHTAPCPVLTVGPRARAPEAGAR